jgi:hypothetical protein
MRSRGERKRPLFHGVYIRRKSKIRRWQPCRLHEIDRLIGDAKPRRRFCHRGNTGFKSNVERLITFSTSLVEVW